MCNHLTVLTGWQNSKITVKMPSTLLLLENQNVQEAIQAGTIDMNAISIDMTRCNIACFALFL